MQHKGILPYCYKLLRFDKQKILLQLRKKETYIKWSDIQAIYPSSFSCRNMGKHYVFELELASSKTYALSVFPKNPASLLENFYDVFVENLRVRTNDVQKVDFCHPTHWIRSKNRGFWGTVIAGGFIALPFLIIAGVSMIYSTKHLEGLESKFVALALILFFPIVYTIIVIKMRIKVHLHKCLLSLKITGNQLTWKDEYGQSGIKSLSDVMTFELDKLKGQLEFSDDTKLTDLEKLRYWPILREHLLSKLEPLEKNEDKSVWSEDS